MRCAHGYPTQARCARVAGVSRGEYRDPSMGPPDRFLDIRYVKFPGDPMRCWMLGSDSLLAECGAILLSQGHTILGVVAPPGRAADWARAHSIPRVDPECDYGAILAQAPFEHLFAITHFSRVPERVLALPARSAINFHDGPLPGRAGRNATVWALLDREPRHGVTWHAMTPVIDGGDILLTRDFAVARDETALSLNTKCFAAALESFGALVEGLAHRALVPLPQSGRTARARRRDERPAAACTIDWTLPAREVEALVRALDFGRYENPIGRAKVHRGGRVLGVLHAEALDDALVSPRCGTVLAVDEERWLVATGAGTLALSGFTDLTGNGRTSAEAARELGVAPGVAFDALGTERAQRLSGLDRRASRAERALVRALAVLEPAPLPVPVAPFERGLLAQPAAIDVEVPASFARGFPARSGDDALGILLVAAFAAFVARTARLHVFDLGYRDDVLRSDTDGLEAWIQTRVPLRIEYHPGEDLVALAVRASASRDEARRRGPWLHDTIARHPALRGLRDGAQGEPLSIGIEWGAAFGAPALPHGIAWTLEIAEASGACRLVHDGRRIARRHAESLARGFAELLAGLAAHPELPLGLQRAVDAGERERQLVEWNGPAREQRRDVCIHVLFEEQARRTPDAIAIVSAGRATTYAELSARARAFAGVLRGRGVRRGTLVGICLERSTELVVAVLGTLAAGGAYLPLDPAFPAARLAFLIEDSGLEVIATDAVSAHVRSAHGAQLVFVDAGAESGDDAGPTPDADAARPEDLAYVIYTSGSTGRPKGVLVEHRSVASFFSAMDEHVPHDPPGTWLAVTSLSFDISVLELLWTLTRGFEVVVPSQRAHARSPEAPTVRPIEFSLAYFASDEDAGGDAGYRLLLEGARFADANGFRAVWTPERHFHPFGGRFPNPAVTGAALATITSHVGIRAGSLVLPLHHPIRVAEDWALVDNLSGGRVAIAFAPGWHPNDFVLAPQNHRSAKGVLYRDLDVVRRLWRGEAVAFAGPGGAAVEIRTHPRPVQPELPAWVTCAGSIETCVEAGWMGANLLTHLLGQSVEELAPKLLAYREARAAAGFDPSTGIVTLMLHTFVGEDADEVRERVRAPLERYLASSLSLLERHTDAFPAFRRGGATNGNGLSHADDGTGAKGAAHGENGVHVNGRKHGPGAAPAEADGLATLAPAERAALLEHARDRFLESSGLIGTPERCAAQVERLRAIGVDEIACLIDFGVPVADVLASLPVLDRVRREAQAPRAPAGDAAEDSLADLIRERRVTHVQCTPSMARVLGSDPATRAALHGVRHLYLGGEALPEDLAHELAARCGAVTNLYGPTETTIWSSAHRVEPDADRAGNAGTVPIGRPIANTTFYVLDPGLEPLPIGVAGELVIGGEGVARGYLRRPELDRERFLPDPFSPVRGARMYRTGDLVRYREDGVVLFLGRTDQQIKLRGHRIEPGEIECLLRREPGVSECVVVAREDRPGDQRLVAYVVARGPEPDPERLQSRLEAALPNYMVPSQFVFLERIPRTPNQKIDRRALPAPEVWSRAPSVSALPANELETRLAELWQSVLGLDRVGVEDNFFDLGGHSMLAVRIHRRLEEFAPKPVTLTDLFRFPTVRSMAGFLSSTPRRDGFDDAERRGAGRRRSLERRQLPGGEA